MELEDARREIMLAAVAMIDTFGSCPMDSGEAMTRFRRSVSVLEIIIYEREQKNLLNQLSLYASKSTTGLITEEELKRMCTDEEFLYEKIVPLPHDTDE